VSPSQSKEVVEWDTKKKQITIGVLVPLAFLAILAICITNYRSRKRETARKAAAAMELTPVASEPVDNRITELGPNSLDPPPVYTRVVRAEEAPPDYATSRIENRA